MFSRNSEGWDSYDTDEFHWVVHRDAHQWRGVGIGISIDVFDSVLHKFATRRGIWIVARIKGLGRVLLGSLHAHTGVTNSIYQGAIHEYFESCPRRFRHLPLLCGVDANETPNWIDGDQNQIEVGNCSTNLNVLLHSALQHGCKPVSPLPAFRDAPTHFPRDATRSGRQIDMIFVRMLSVGSFAIDADKRHVIGSDHGVVFAEISVSVGRSSSRWGGDSRARWVTSPLPETILVEAQDLTSLARQCTRPRTSSAYRDNEDIREAIKSARAQGTAAAWKKVHKIRRAARKQWKLERLSSILAGDWEEYRRLQSEKKRCRGWWGPLLADHSAADLTRDITLHLEGKMCDKARSDWDVILQAKIDAVNARGEFRPFSLIDMRTELQTMRARSAVGPDLVGVHLLREIANHDTLAYDMLDLINHIVSTLALPEIWDKSFLALLAKCPNPQRVNDLRPICVSSTFQKLISKMVCARALPGLRRGSRISCCGRGRQSADLIGCISRIRDTTKEWKLPFILCKLDVAGAFDKVDRSKVVDLLVDRLRDKDLDAELRFLLAQLRTHTLEGIAPGGGKVCLSPNIGIKQGAPESAEIFGLVVDALLMELVSCRQWGEFGWPFENLQVTFSFTRMTSFSSRPILADWHAASEQLTNAFNEPAFF